MKLVRNCTSGKLVRAAGGALVDNRNGTNCCCVHAPSSFCPAPGNDTANYWRVDLAGVTVSTDCLIPDQSGCAVDDSGHSVGFCLGGLTCYPTAEYPNDSYCVQWDEFGVGPAPQYNADDGYLYGSTTYWRMNCLSIQAWNGRDEYGVYTTAGCTLHNGKSVGQYNCTDAGSWAFGRVEVRARPVAGGTTTPDPATLQYRLIVLMPADPLTPTGEYGNSQALYAVLFLSAWTDADQTGKGPCFQSLTFTNTLSAGQWIGHLYSDALYYDAFRAYYMGVASGGTATLTFCGCTTPSDAETIGSQYFFCRCPGSGGGCPTSKSIVVSGATDPDGSCISPDGTFVLAQVNLNTWSYTDPGTGYIYTLGWMTAAATGLDADGWAVSIAGNCPDATSRIGYWANTGQGVCPPNGTYDQVGPFNQWAAGSVDVA